MKCHVCGKESAVINIRQIIGSEIKDLTLCRQCAEKKGILGKGDKIELSLNQILDGLVSSGGNRKKADSETCSACGMKAKESGKEGRTGCSECFNAFPEEISKYLEKNGITASHLGKLPRSLQTIKTLIFDRDKLNTELKHAIETEDYENAALIRDRIKELEDKTGVIND